MRTEFTPDGIELVKNHPALDTQILWKLPTALLIKCNLLKADLNTQMHLNENFAEGCLINKLQS